MYAAPEKDPLVRLPQPPPSVLLILADDLGYNDVSYNYNGGTFAKIQTPNIDSIARNGVIFSKFYAAASVCGPSRNGLMTGRYPQRWGIHGNLPLATTERTLSEALKLSRSPYTNYMVGKWHLGSHQLQRPMARGFDQFFGFLNGGHRYRPDELFSDRGGYESLIQRDGKNVTTTKYLTEEFTDAGVAYIDSHFSTRAAAAPPPPPFFLYMAYNAPHTPIDSPQTYQDRYRRSNEKGGNIGSRPGKRVVYAGMVICLDDGVGELLKALRRRNAEENTIVIFTSDNGGISTDGKGYHGQSNSPLKGGKESYNEGGIRVPFVMQWKGTLSSDVNYRKLASAFDIAATITSLAGVPAADCQPYDGINLMPHMSMETSSKYASVLAAAKRMGNYGCISNGAADTKCAPRELFFDMCKSRKAGHRSAVVQDTPLKLYKINTGHALYKLDEDGTGEETNVTQYYLPTFNTLKAKLEAWKHTMPVPTSSRCSEGDKLLYGGSFSACPAPAGVANKGQKGSRRVFHNRTRIHTVHWENSRDVT